MNYDEITRGIKNILINHFEVKPDDFQWDIPLVALNKDFEVLGIMLELESLVYKHFKKKIPLVEHIDPIFDTLSDIAKLIEASFSPGNNIS